MIWNVPGWVAPKPSVRARIEFGGHERFKEECRENIACQISPDPSLSVEGEKSIARARRARVID
jgi:hypothetical protein